MSKGWRGESYRHGLSSRGIKNRRDKTEIPHLDDYVFPIENRNVQIKSTEQKWAENYLKQRHYNYIMSKVYTDPEQHAKENPMFARNISFSSRDIMKDDEFDEFFLSEKIEQLDQDTAGDIPLDEHGKPMLYVGLHNPEWLSERELQDWIDDIPEWTMETRDGELILAVTYKENANHASERFEYTREEYNKQLSFEGVDVPERERILNAYFGEEP